MPSVDVIRNITIKGKADGVDDATAALNRLTDSIKAANENLAKSSSAANDNAAGFRITGEGAVSAANHLRQAAEAAYVFSPAFRSVVNELAVPALSAAGTALEAVAAGIVTATNVAGTGLIRLGTTAETSIPAIAGLAGGVKAAGVWMEAFSPTISGVAVSIASKLLPALSLLGKGLLIYDAIKLVTQAWELGNAKLAEYVALSEKAATSGVSTDFYQRISKAATDAKAPIEALTEAFKKLNEASAPTLGGTAAQNRLTEVAGAGNFSGNSGVGQLQGANSNEERLRALATLYDQAIAKGERLAALDIVKAFGGETLANNLAKDSGYLDDMIEKADKIKQDDLISAGTVANAVELQNRLDAAEKILSQRWHPIQDILTGLGIKMKEAWVGIVEAIAKAVDSVFTLAQKIVDFLSPMISFLKLADQVVAKVASIAGSIVPGPIGALVGAAGMVGGSLLKDGDQAAAADAQREALLADARKRLAEGLNRKFDTSTNPAKATEADTAAYDRATESILKYIKVTEAASKTVSDSVAEQEKYKVIAQLTAAAEKDKTPITAALSAEMAKLGERAGAAALALEKARVANEIKFGANTSLLSQEDVQIATRLKGLYPDVATALGSVEAQGLRVNNAFKTISSTIETNLTSGLTDIVTGTTNVSDGFKNMGIAVLKAIEQMIIKIAIVQPMMAALQASVNSSGILSFLGIGGGVAAGATSTGAAGVGSLGGLYHTGGIVGSEPTSMRYVHPAYFDDAPKFHTGGIAGDEVPIIAKRGEGVFTQGQMAALGGGGNSTPNITYSPTIDARGADSSAVAKLAQIVADDKKNFAKNVLQIQQAYRTNNPRSA